MLGRSILVASLLIPVAAFARSRADYTREAKEAVEKALDVNDASNSDCQAGLERKLEKLSKAAREAANRNTDRAIQKALDQAKRVREKAEDDCPGDMTQAVEAPLDRAIRMYTRALGNGEGDDDDEDQGGAPPPPPPPPAGFQFDGLSVQPNQMYNGQMAVAVAVNGAQLSGLAGHQIVFSVRIRSTRGPWLDAVSLDPWPCNQDVCAVGQPLVFYYPQDALCGSNMDAGRFEARVAAFDPQTGLVVGAREVEFRMNLAAPPPPPPPPPPPAMGDCGVGPDPACGRPRNGVLPMDYGTFTGLLNALRAQPNEILRKNTTLQWFQGRSLTTRQLGAILDQFPNEIFRFQIGEAGLSHLVDPENAIALASKYQNAIYVDQFSKLAAQQHNP